MAPFTVTSVLLFFITKCVCEQKLCQKPNCSNIEVAFCLADDQSQKCTADCFPQQKIPRGYYTRRDTHSNRLDAVACPDGTFQPEDDPPGDKCWCQTQSSCRDDGQIVSSNGSNIENRCCRCDYRQNYTYAETPNNKCHCRPRTENCHCVKAVCPQGKRLSADYICVDAANLNINLTCEPLEYKFKTSMNNGNNTNYGIPTAVVNYTTESQTFISSSTEFIVMMFFAGFITGIICSVATFVLVKVCLNKVDQSEANTQKGKAIYRQADGKKETMNDSCSRSKLLGPSATASNVVKASTGLRYKNEKGNKQHGDIIDLGKSKASYRNVKDDVDVVGNE